MKVPKRIDFYELAKDGLAEFNFYKYMDACDLYISQHKTEFKESVIEAYLQGFKISAEGWNGEYPYMDNNISDEKILNAIQADEYYTDKYESN